MAEATQTESDSEEATSPEESSIEDVVKGGAIGTPEVNSSMEVEVKLSSREKVFEGATAEGRGIENKAEAVIEATGCSRRESSIVDTGYLTEEEDFIESKPEVFEQTLNEGKNVEGGNKKSFTAKGLVTIGSKDKSVDSEKTAGKRVTADGVDKVARAPQNSVRKVERTSGGGRSRQRRDNPRTVKAHHSGWKVI